MPALKNSYLVYCTFTLAIMALMIATGIGRFVFTPIIPVMLAENTVEMSEVIWLSSANYIGYFFGAMSLFKNTRHILLLLLGICLVTVTTFFSSMTDFVTIFIFRLLAGIGGAWALVSASAWAIPRLTALKVKKVGFIYMGVGAGIALSGLVCSGLILLESSATQLWYAIAAISLFLSSAVCLLLKLTFTQTNAIFDAVHSANADSHIQNETDTTITAGDTGESLSVWRLAVAYGLFGFGYIIPATFLPKMAKDMLEGNAFLLIWPIFGLASVLTVALTQFFTHVADIKIWRIAQAIIGCATLLPLFSKSLTTLLLTTLLVGGTFMVVIMSILKIAAKMRKSYNVVALMTASFAFGQLAGPLPALFLTETNIWTYILPLSACSSLCGVMFLWGQKSSK